MAKIMLGSLAGAISGALGNDVFSHNRGGAYVRRRVIPTKVVNDNTVLVRNILTSCSRAWGTLDPEEQMAWNTWADSHPITDRLGQKQVLFGAAAYTQLNSRIMRGGDTVIDLPPMTAAPSPFLTFTVAPEEATQTCVCTFTATPLAAWIQAALVTNPGRQYYANLLKLVSVSAKALVTGVDIGPAIVDRFGAMQEGQLLHVMASVYESTSGMLSGPTLHSIAVVA